jgi:hypothetical protein
MVDLLYINCEGCEYDVLEYMIDSGWIARMEHVLVQFHGFQDPANVAKRCLIRELLRRTHSPVFSYAFVWEEWKVNPQRQADH